MKLLTVCSGGNSRSVSMAMCLKMEFEERDVIAMGIDFTSEETKKMLFEWADGIIVVGEFALFQKVPKEYLAKTYHVDVGPDRWVNPFHLELYQMCYTWCQSRVKETAGTGLRPPEVPV